MWLRPSVLALLSPLLLGCPSVQPPASQMPTPADALARMRATYACVNGVQGEAKIDTFSRQGRIRGDAALLAVNPDRIRFDLFSPFGAIVFTLTSDGQRFQLLDTREKQFLYGPATACNLARFTQVPIPGHALASLLRGEAPVLKHAPEAASMEWDTSSPGFYRVRLAGRHEATEEIHLGIRPEDRDKPWSAQRIRVLDVRVAQQGTDLYHVELRNHRPSQTAGPRLDPDGIDDPVPPIGGACDAEIPESIRMRVPRTTDDVILQYRKAAWNPPIIENTFTQPVPGGVERRYVDCP